MEATPPKVPPARRLARDTGVGARVARRAIVVVPLSAVIASLLLAIPGLEGVERQIAGLNPAWMVATVVLELGSSFAFVVVFRLFGALIAYGAPATQAAAAVIVYHAIAFWIPSLGGLAGYWLVQRREPRAASRLRNCVQRYRGRGRSRRSSR